MQKFILVISLVSLSTLLHASDTKLKAYDCRAHIPITPEDSKFIYALDYINSMDVFELVEEKMDGIVIAAFDTDKKSAIDKATHWIQRKYGFKFKGKLLKCAHFEVEELWWEEI